MIQVSTVLKQTLLRSKLHHWINVYPSDGVRCGYVRPWSDNHTYKQFVEFVRGDAVIMDMELWVSLNSPIPGVLNIVVCSGEETTDKYLIKPDITIRQEELLNILELHPRLLSENRELYLLGGIESFNKTMRCVKKVHFCKSQQIVNKGVLKSYPVGLLNMLSKAGPFSVISGSDINRRSYRVESYKIDVWKQLFLKRYINAYEKKMFRILLRNSVEHMEKYT